MDSLGLNRTDFTQPLLMRLYAANNADEMSVNLMLSEPDSSATGHMFANAIKSCKDLVINKIYLFYSYLNNIFRNHH